MTALHALLAAPAWLDRVALAPCLSGCVATAVIFYRLIVMLGGDGRRLDR